VGAALFSFRLPRRLPLDGALREIDQVRAWTTDFIRRLVRPRPGRAGPGTTPSPARTNATKLASAPPPEHLEVHARHRSSAILSAAWSAEAPALIPKCDGGMRASGVPARRLLTARDHFRKRSEFAITDKETDERPHRRAREQSG
jgi:hypothetical protein